MEWLKEVEQEAREIVAGSQPVPTSLEFHPGTTCPLACVFCHTARSETTIYHSSYRNRHPVLSLPQMKSIIETFVQLGGKEFVVSGGLEPFVSPIALPSISHAKQLGLRTVVYTNGVGGHLGHRSVPTLLEVCDRVRFSVHGLSASTFAAIEAPHLPETAARRMYDRLCSLICQALRVSSETGTRVGISFLLQTRNIYELEAFLDRWTGEGIAFVDLRTDIMGEYNLTPQLMDFVRETLGRFRGSPTQFSFERIGSVATSPPPRCESFRSRLVIDAFGGTHACCITADRPADSAPFGFGFVHDSCSFRSLLEDLARRSPISPYCAVCSERSVALNRALADLRADVGH